MKEIKFRAWYRRPKNCVKGGEMFMSFPMTIENLLNPINGYEFIKIGTYGVDEHFVLAPETILMQFTGLKDKQGKEIYEGDIVKVDFDGEEQTIHTVFYGIEYDYPAFDLDPDLACDCDCNGLQYCICSGSITIEVVGNIYENPELLRKDL